MFEKIQNELQATNTTLVAVSKTKPVEQILEIYQLGQRIFGENRVQELLSKKDVLPKDIQWHLIGHLQTNKVKYIIDCVDLIHSVDSIKLLQEINKQAAKIDRKIPILLQFKIASEDTKYGFDLPALIPFLESEDFGNLQNVAFQGVMGMATFTDDQDQVREEFSILKHIFTQLKNQHFQDNQDFIHISMGMSGDYKLAIEEGSTMVRIGSLIFGNR